MKSDWYFLSRGRWQFRQDYIILTDLTPVGPDATDWKATFYCTDHSIVILQFNGADVDEAKARAITELISLGWRI